MEIVRKFLTPAEFSNPSIRYNPDGDIVQFTPDGGTTWYDAPTLDPRHADTFRLPPLGGDDTRCRAAVGMTELVRRAVDERIDAVTAIEFAGGILGVAAFIPGFNVMYALVLAFATVALSIGRELLEAAFTEEVYDQIQCIFFNNLGDDGQMSAAQFDDAYAALIDLDTIARTWVQYIFNTFGEVGLSDAGVALAAAGDCFACDDEWCYRWWGTGFEQGDWVMETYPETTPTVYEDDRVVGGLQVTGAPSYAHIAQVFYDMPPANITYIGFSIDYERVGGEAANYAWLEINGVDVAHSPNLSGAGIALLTWEGSRDDITSLRVIGGVEANSAGDGHFWLTSVTMRGAGENPIDEDNCS